jgi:hypothetical protein
MRQSMGSKVALAPSAHCWVRRSCGSDARWYRECDKETKSLAFVSGGIFSPETLVVSRWEARAGPEMKSYMSRVFFWRVCKMTLTEIRRGFNEFAESGDAGTNRRRERRSDGRHLTWMLRKKTGQPDNEVGRSCVISRYSARSRILLTLTAINLIIISAYVHPMHAGSHSPGGIRKYEPETVRAGPSRPIPVPKRADQWWLVPRLLSRPDGAAWAGHPSSSSVVNSEFSKCNWPPAGATLKTGPRSHCGQVQDSCAHLHARARARKPPTGGRYVWACACACAWGCLA